VGERKLSNDNVADDVIGLAAPSACQISVLYHRLTPMMFLRNVGEMLGRVIAHELGHLLLAGQGHSDIGIMRGTFAMSPDVPPVFTTEQEATIRSSITGRALSHCRDVR
jgi:hypothetical protein